ncbi:hypothetical protein [Legionella donaldsonii]|uniref:hypothetical protein n=1 Tax=Legionella donaldsonii TaxID=45060 RepID=UPI00399CF3EF
MNKKYIEKEKIEEAIKNKFWTVYNNNTSKLSSICRQLAFAEGGICWFYISNDSFPFEIKLILIFLLLFFMADAGQYFLLAMNNKKQAEFYEYLLEQGTITSPEQILRPIKINSSGNFCFGLKLFLLTVASILLIVKIYYQSGKV